MYFGFLNSVEEEGRLSSPLIFSQLNNDEDEEREMPPHDIFKSEVFSLGMTLLECATLERAEQYYNIKTHKIRFAQIRAKLENLRKVYSSSFVELLQSALSESEHSRPAFSEIIGGREARIDFTTEFPGKIAQKPQSKKVSFLISLECLN